MVKPVSIKNLRIKRRYRYPFKVIIITSEICSIELNSHGIDLSESGLRTSLSNKLITGTVVICKMQSPSDDDEINISGKVVWVKESIKFKGRYDTGINFIFVSESIKKDIQNFIKKINEKKRPVSKYMKAFETDNRDFLNGKDEKLSDTAKIIILAFIIFFHVVLIGSAYYLISRYIQDLAEF